MPKYILLPNSTFRVSWDMYVGVLLMGIAVYVPYRVTFLQDLETVWRYVEHAVDISFGIDIVLNFFTAYHIGTDGHLEYGMKNIATRYAKSFLIIDVVATFPFDLVIPSGSSDSGVNRSAKLANLGKGMKVRDCASRELRRVAIGTISILHRLGTSARPASVDPRFARPATYSAPPRPQATSRLPPPEVHNGHGAQLQRPSWRQQDVQHHYCSAAGNASRWMCLVLPRDTRR